MNKIFCNKNMVYKTVSILLTISIFFTLTFQNHVYASGDPIAHKEHKKSTSYNYGAGWNDIYAASSMGFMGGTWLPEVDAWHCTFKFVGTGASRVRNSGNASNIIRIASMEIKSTYNKDHIALLDSNDERYIGSAPGSGSQPDYSDFANAIVGLAITAINNLGASYVWSVVGLIGAFFSCVDSESSDNKRLWRQWDWSSDISDTGQFFWFFADVDPNQKVQLSYDYMIFGPGYELLQPGKGYMTIETPGPKSRTSNWNPGMMSDEEKRKYDIEEIPLEDVAKRAEELNIPSNITEDFYKSGDQILYYAHNLLGSNVEFQGEASPEIKTTDMTKDMLIEEINTQMDQNNLIIRAFSSIKNITQEDIAIIDKNKAEQKLLENLLKEVKSIDNNDSNEFNLILSRFQEIISKNATDY